MGEASDIRLLLTNSCLHYDCRGGRIGGRVFFLGGGTVGRFALSVAKNQGGLGPSETKSESIFRPIVMIF